MKKFLDNSANKFILVILIGIFFRFYQLELRTNFTADPGRDFLLVKQIITEHKLTLLGPKTSLGNFFFGPLYYYLLLPAVAIGNFDPLSGAVLTASLDILSLIIFSLLVYKLLPLPAAILSSVLYATSPLLITMVQIPLNPFVVPIFMSLYLLLLNRSPDKYPLSATFGLGLAAGSLFELHYATFPAILVGAFASFRGKNKVMNFGAFSTGVILGILPMLLFELRHQFFNTHGIIEFISQQNSTLTVSNLLPVLAKSKDIFNQLTLSSKLPLFWFMLALLILGIFRPSQKNQTFWRLNKILLLICLITFLILGKNFSDHYAILIFPVIFLFIGKGIDFFPPKIIYLVTFTVLIFNSISLLTPRAQGNLMSPGWNLPGIRHAVKLIAADNPPSKFEVAAVMDGDTRAMPYRYLLEAKYNKIPLSVEAYPQADVLYVITREPADIVIHNPVWEISSLVKKQVTKTWVIQNNILLHRIEKIN